MAEIRGTFDGFEGERGHLWGCLNGDASQKLFFHKRCAASDNFEVDRCLSEIAHVNQFDHPNIHQLLGHLIENDKCSPDASFFVYSSLTDFGSINRIISMFDNHGLSEEIIQNIICQVLPAICYLHKRKIIHRGINSQNILVDSDGTIQLSGFEHAISITNSNRWIGVEDRVHHFDESLQKVFIWLAPEILKQDLNGYGLLSDVYSIGITVCEMGNGFSPFSEMQPLQVLYEKIRGSTPFLIDAEDEPLISTIEARNDQLNYTKPAFSSNIHDFVSKCLTYDCKERPSSWELRRHNFVETSINKNDLKKTLKNLLSAKVLPLSLI